MYRETAAPKTHAEIVSSTTSRAFYGLASRPWARSSEVSWAVTLQKTERPGEPAFHSLLRQLVIVDLRQTGYVTRRLVCGLGVAMSQTRQPRERRDQQSISQ